MRDLFGDRVEWGTLERDNLEITAFDHPRDYGEHFKGRYGPTIVAETTRSRTAKEAEFDEASNNSAKSGIAARTTTREFEQEYLVAVGTRA